jgi:hypothetical protein
MPLRTYTTSSSRWRPALNGIGANFFSMPHEILGHIADLAVAGYLQVSREHFRVLGKPGLHRD